MHETSTQVNHAKFATPWILFAVGFLLLLPGITNIPNIYDEGIVVYGASRILTGDVPYRDFWTMYGPGQYYTLAILFKVFGPSLMVERLWDVIVRAALSVLIYLTARKLTSRGLSLITWFLALLWLWYLRLPGYPLLPSLLFAWASAHFLLEIFTDNKKPYALFISGMCLGIATIFRHDIGLYTLVVETGTMCLFFLTRAHISSRRQFGEAVGIVLKTSMPYMAGMGLALAPVFMFFAVTVPFGELAYDLVLFPATVFPSVRQLPFPVFPTFVDGLSPGTFFRIAVDTGSLYFPLAVDVFSVIMILRRVRQQRLSTSPLNGSSVEAWWSIALLTLLSMALFLKGIVRPELVHMPQAFLPALVALFALVYQLRYGLRKAGYSVLMAITIPFLAMIYAPPAEIAWQTLSRPEGGYNIYRNLITDEQRVQDITLAGRVNLAKDQIATLRFIRQHVPPEQPIFSGNIRHDRIFINDVMFYFLAQRSSATKYHELHPGLATTAAIQENIIQDLARKDVRYIVLYSGGEYRNEPNMSSRSSGIKLLDNFILKNYQQVQLVGQYAVWEKLTQGQLPAT